MIMLQRNRVRHSVSYPISTHRVRRRLGIIEQLESRHLLAGIEVTTLADVVDSGDGVTSLREAILSSVASPDDDTIEFAPALTTAGAATIVLTEGPLVISSAVAIIGPGADLLTIDAGHGIDKQFNTSDGHKVFLVDDGDRSVFTKVTLSGLTITGGDTEAASLGGGDAFRFRFGGGIQNSEDLTLQGVHLFRNAAVDGGGLYNERGTVHLIDSTVSGNIAQLIAAADDGGFGGGIYSLSNGTVDVRNSTISGNTATMLGGGIAIVGTLNVELSTITDNTAIERGGGIAVIQGSGVVHQSIVSGNESDRDKNLSDGVQILITGDYNVIGSGEMTGGTHDVLTDAPLLGPLADNGGSTPTHAVLAGSPAIDAGDPAMNDFTIPYDQRGVGFDRIFDGDENGTSIVDAGAIELVTAVNRQPTLTLGSTPVTREDSGPYFSARFATFDPGDPSESNQSVLAYHINHIQQPDLFSDPPAIDANGTLTFTPAANAFGFTTLEVTVQDDGGNANGGVDTSEAQELTITITPVNDAPALEAAALPPVTGGAGSQVVPRFITNFDPGAANESGQSVARYIVNVTEVTGAVGDFFASDPRIDNQGNLSYAVREDILVGTATLQVSVQDDGGTDDGGVDTSVAETFTLNVVGADFGDAPDTFPVTRAQAGAHHISGTLRLGTQIDSELDGVSSADANSDNGDDGVLPIASLLGVSGVATTSSFEIIASEAGRLDAWVDYNGDGDWSDAGEQIAIYFALSAGSNTLSFAVPATAVPGPHVARFRISSAGFLPPTGRADDGEVEDYIETVLDSSLDPEVFVDVLDNQTFILKRQTEIVVTDGTADLFAAPADRVAALRVLGTDSDETISLDLGALSFSRPLVIDAADGEDTLLVIQTDGELDLTTQQVSLENFSIINLGDQNANTLVVDLAAERAIAPDDRVIRVAGGDGDAIRFVDRDDWRMGPTSIVDGVFLRSALHIGGGNERIDVDLPRPWQNLVLPNDVNNSGGISPTDALAIINELARQRFFNSTSSLLVHPLTVTSWPDLYVDSNGDGHLTPRDALLVINELAQMIESGSVEGESMPTLRSLGIAAAAHQAPAVVEWEELFDSENENNERSWLIDTAPATRRFAATATPQVVPHSSSEGTPANGAAIDQLLCEKDFLGSLLTTDLKKGQKQ